jgi:hypothetical protein
MRIDVIFGWRQLALACLLIVSSAHARLGDGPGIDDLITHADVVCAGRIAGYETVTVTGDSNSMWLAIRFIVDHEIKGSSPTNALMILMSRLEQPTRAKDILAQLGEEKKGFRFLAFLKTTDIKRSQFKLADDMDGMIRVGPIAPSIESETEPERRIQIEMTQGLKQLDAAHQEQIRTMSDRWQRGKYTVTNKQEEVKDSGH